MQPQTLLLEANDDEEMGFLEQLLIISDSANQIQNEITDESKKNNFMINLQIRATQICHSDEGL